MARYAYVLESLNEVNTDHVLFACKHLYVIPEAVAVEAGKCPDVLSQSS